MEDGKMPGTRLLQLAINEAVHSRLCLMSPIKSQIEKEMRNKNSKLNKVALQSKSTYQNPRFASNRSREEGLRNCVYEERPIHHSNVGLHTAKNQDKHLPFSKPTFSDQNRSGFYSQSFENDYISVPFNSKSNNQGTLQFSTGSRYIQASPTAPDSLQSKPGKFSDVPASVDYKCIWSDEESSSTFCGFEENTTNPTAIHRTFVDSQLISSNSNCDSQSITKSTMHSNTVSSDYDLLMFSNGCELSKPSNEYRFKGLDAFSKHENRLPEISKISTNLLEHSTLPSLDNSLIQSKEESSSSNNFTLPLSGSDWFNISEQNALGNSEIPVPLYSGDQTYSSTCNAIPTRKHFDRFNDNFTLNNKIAQSSLNSAAVDFLNKNTVLDHYLKSDPDYSTLKHFVGLISEKNPPLITLTADNLELKIVPQPSQLNDVDAGCPIPKPHAIGAESSDTSACKNKLNRHDYLLDYFLNLNDKSV